jgi:hypothetical protein
MRLKGNLKTVRLGEKEIKLVEEFLGQNPSIENFSTLARIAILDFVAKKGTISIRPILDEEPKKRPSFLWDYDLSESQVKEILSGPLGKRKWLVAKILEHAKFDEIWKYLTVRDIERDLPFLRLPKKTKEHWQFAIKRWRKAK